MTRPRSAIILASAAALALAGCNPLNLTPQQQTNLQNEIALGKTVLQASVNLYCVVEPTTNALIGTFDTSAHTAASLAKMTQATTILCNAALKNAPATTVGG